VARIFSEYEKLSLASGLYLNADKTEKFNIHSRDILAPEPSNDVTYNNDNFIINAQTSIKINGIFFDLNEQRMATLNFDNMTHKMDTHFRNWSKRSLSILGKIQIIKTFGLSQYLYALAVLDIDQAQWKQVHKLIFKFIWNKHYNGNRAVHRIKNETMYTDVLAGGFGLLNLEEVVKALRLRHFAMLESGFNHPIASLQRKLGSDCFLKEAPRFAIDCITQTALKQLHEHNLTALLTYPIDQLVNDRLFRQKLLRTRLNDICQKIRRNSIEMINFRRNGVSTIADLVAPADLNSFTRICLPSLRPIIREIMTLPPDLNQPDPVPITNCRIYLGEYNKWQHLILLTSRNIRNIMFKRNIILNPKLTNLMPDEATLIYKKINQLSSIQLKTKMHRMLHGDIYCGARLVEFNMSDNDRCIRCFEQETISHLLYECPYSREIWSRLQIDTRNKNITDILNVNCSDATFEIRATLIELLLFKKVQMAPNAMIKITVEKFAYGLSKKGHIKRATANILNDFNINWQWDL
jgi:hypothetical protein